jgi:flagellar rod protein FlaI
MIQIDQQQLIDSWHGKVDALEDLDHEIEQILQHDDPQQPELAPLINQRERLLQKVTIILRQLPQLYQSAAWERALTRTKGIVEKMESQTAALRLQTQRVQHGHQSLKQYQRFR